MFILAWLFNVTMIIGLVVFFPIVFHLLGLLFCLSVLALVITAAIFVWIEQSRK